MLILYKFIKNNGKFHYYINVWVCVCFFYKKKMLHVFFIYSQKKKCKLRAFLDDEKCSTDETSADSNKYCTAVRGECFQEQARHDDVPDAHCDQRSGHCRGFNTSSMLWAFGGGILLDFLGAKREMFPNNVGRNRDMEKATQQFVQTLSDIVRNTTLSERARRWDVERVLQQLRMLYNRSEGKRCFTRFQWHIRRV